MYWPKLEFHKLVLHPNFCVQEAMGLFFYAQIGVSHYFRPVLHPKLFSTGPWRYVLAQTGVSH